MKSKDSQDKKYQDLGLRSELLSGVMHPEFDRIQNTVSLYSVSPKQRQMAKDPINWSKASEKPMFSDAFREANPGLEAEYREALKTGEGKKIVAAEQKVVEAADKFKTENSTEYNQFKLEHAEKRKPVTPEITRRSVRSSGFDMIEDEKEVKEQAPNNSKEVFEQHHGGADKANKHIEDTFDDMSKEIQDAKAHTENLASILAKQNQAIERKRGIEKSFLNRLANALTANPTVSSERESNLTASAGKGQGAATKQNSQGRG